MPRVLYPLLMHVRTRETDLQCARAELCRVFRRRLAVLARDDRLLYTLLKLHRRLDRRQREGGGVGRGGDGTDHACMRAQVPLFV